MRTNIFKTIAIFGVVASGLLFTSCEDFLTITPSSQIVEEDFWEDKTDLENVVAACYGRMIRSDMTEKYIVCGELRSDNFVQKSGNGSNNIRNIMNGNLIPNNNMFSWSCFYNAINYCNKVLAHGPEIVAKDESFSQGDWEPIKAEMLALRALNHFYLVRTYGEIPYVTTDFNNDSQYMLQPQVTQEQALDSIIMDLEEAKNYAMESYGNTIYNKGRFTKKSIYTLLADVYLWRASKNTCPDSVAVYGNQATEDYRKVVEYCDWVLNDIIKDRTKELNESGAVLGGLNFDLTLDDLFIQNEQTPGASVIRSSNIGAYNYIFGRGNSSESIFEFQFDNNSGNTNGSLSGYYLSFGSTNNAGSIVLSEAIFGSPLEDLNSSAPTSVYTKTDYRKWENMLYTSAQQTEYPCCKYILNNVSQGVGSSNTVTDNSSWNSNNTQSKKSVNNSNWILYRLSDIVFMRAEAISQISTSEEELLESVKSIREIFKRSNPYAYATSNNHASTDSLNTEFFSASGEMLEALVMSERQREFVGEGKRWFDLVRYAQRRGSTAAMFDRYLGRKYGDNKDAVKSKLSTITSLFSPIFRDEMYANPLLHQNSVWITSESTSKTDNL